MTKSPRAARAVLQPTGVKEIDALAERRAISLTEYVAAASAYVRQQSSLSPGPKKSSQIRLSNALARVLSNELEAKLPKLAGRIVTEERKVAGGLRTANADLSESHDLDGLRLAVEIKPINLAVGRAIWNRFGDIRTFAVNIHLKFRFAVVGGVLAIPTYEVTGTQAAQEAEREEESAEMDRATDAVLNDRNLNDASAKRSTLHLIERAIERLVRAGGRRSEADADHLLEGIAVIVYDPDTATIHPDIPRVGSRLRWDEFVDDLVAAYKARFED